MSTASEQPGHGRPEEPAESLEPREGAAEEVATGSADSAGLSPDMPELPELSDLILPALPELSAAGDGAGEPGAEAGTDAAADIAADIESGAEPEPGPETEEERIARERVEFDKLVAAFHSESAPDPQPHRPETPGQRRIVRYPVLDPRPEWPAEIMEPSDETADDPLDYVEHYEPPDPPLPQVATATLASWTMLLGGVAFLVLHTLLKWETPEYLGWLAVIGVFGGIITLVARMKPDRDEYDDPDNGAVV